MEDLLQEKGIWPGLWKGQVGDLPAEGRDWVQTTDPAAAAPRLPVEAGAAATPGWVGPAQPPSSLSASPAMLGLLVPQPPGWESPRPAPGARETASQRIDARILAESTHFGEERLRVVTPLSPVSLPPQLQQHKDEDLSSLAQVRGWGL